MNDLWDCMSERRKRGTIIIIITCSQKLSSTQPVGRRVDHATREKRNIDPKFNEENVARQVDHARREKRNIDPKVNEANVARQVEGF